ncbi:MAG: helix-turn-helix domain-containing protein [Actinomycetes bacterium]|jgi:predicted nucleotidyltransferase/DNA-binding XRE family transcriptional regulator
MATDAGSILRSAREQAGLSQSALAERVGIAQSVISAYERGHREPSFRTLERLVAGTGHELQVEISTASPELKVLPLTTTGHLLRRTRRTILLLAAARGAFNVRVFGSVARGDDGELSDVDFLVDLSDGTSLLDLIGLERELGELLGRDVDVIPSDSLKPRVRDQIMSESVQL